MLIDIIEELQKDNLVMYAPDDGAVILIWEWRIIV